MLPQQSSTSRRRLTCSRRYCRGLRHRILQLIILSISCASIFAKQHNTQQHNQKQKRHRRMQVAPLNTYLLVKDEFDKHRSDIESFVFQTLGMFYLIYTSAFCLDIWSDWPLIATIYLYTPRLTNPLIHFHILNYCRFWFDLIWYASFTTSEVNFYRNLFPIHPLDAYLMLPSISYMIINLQMNKSLSGGNIKMLVWYRDWMGVLRKQFS